MTPLRVVALTDDGYTHLSRLGANTLCQKRVLREGTAGPPCSTCMSLWARWNHRKDRRDGPSRRAHRRP